MKIIRNIAKNYIEEVSILTNPQYQNFLEKNKDKNIVISFFRKELLLDIKTDYIDKLLKVQIDYTLSALNDHIKNELKEENVKFINVTINDENVDFFNSYYKTEKNQVENTILYMRKGVSEVYEQNLYIPKPEYYDMINKLYDMDIKKLIDGL
jgi:hypothetical protein